MPGPVPKRADQRRRRNKPEGPALIKAASGQPADPDDDLWLAPMSHWHPVATYWYTSLAESGQSVFYEPSDIATAVYVAEAMSRSLAGTKMSGQMFAAVMSAMTDLLTTEAARRRARIELERGEVEEEEDPIKKLMEAYQDIAKQ